MMKRLAVFIAGIMLASCAMSAPTVGANLRMHGGTSTPEPPTTDTCPLGLTWVSFDKCLDANPEGQFREPNAVSLYALGISGGAQTIYHPAPYNKAGIDFPVGQLTTTGKDDPRDFTVIGVATFKNNTVTFTRIDNGGTPATGMYVWDRPANGTAWFPNATAPRISGACTGSIPALVCPLDKTVTTRSAFIVFASQWYGCVNQTSGIDWLLVYTGKTGTTYDYDMIYCDFRNSADQATAEIENITTAPINGHNATVLEVTTHNSGGSYGTVIIDNSYLTIDENTKRVPILSSGVGSRNARLILRNSECDGGLSGDPIAGPFTFPEEGSCFNWDSPGSTTWGRNQVLIQNLYVHDWSGRPMSTQAGNTDTVIQNVYAIRVNLNCGDDTPPSGTSNGCHGTLIGHGTSIRASSGSIKLFNITAVYPYGQRNGVISGVLSIQGGASSANTIDYEMGGLTVLANTGGAAGHATAGTVMRVARVGEISSFKAQHVYVNSHGVSGCLVTTGDLQANGATTGAMVSNAGTDTSTITWSGFSGSASLYYPGTAIVVGEPSSATTFKATMADNGNGTSTLTITQSPPSTMAAGTQIVALWIADMMNNPTVVVSGSGSSYIVRNGSGSGETRAEQTFHIANVIKPFGTIDPATGLPSTAVGGSLITGYNGTVVAGGNKNATPKSPSNWAAMGPRIGNVTALEDDVHDLYMMNIAGDGGKIVLDGVDLADSTCPGTQSP